MKLRGFCEIVATWSTRGNIFVVVKFSQCLDLMQKYVIDWHSVVVHVRL